MNMEGKKIWKKNDIYDIKPQVDKEFNRHFNSLQHNPDFQRPC